METHPCVAARLRQERLTLHGWVYQIDTGRVFTYVPEQGQFVPSGEVLPGSDMASLVNIRSI